MAPLASKQPALKGEICDVLRQVKESSKPNMQRTLFDERDEREPNPAFIQSHVGIARMAEHALAWVQGDSRADRHLRVSGLAGALVTNFATPKDYFESRDALLKRIATLPVPSGNPAITRQTLSFIVEEDVPLVHLPLEGDTFGTWNGGAIWVRPVADLLDDRTKAHDPHFATRCEASILAHELRHLVDHAQQAASPRLAPHPRDWDRETFVKLFLENEERATVAGSVVAVEVGIQGGGHGAVIKAIRKNEAWESLHALAGRILPDSYRQRAEKSWDDADALAKLEAKLFGETQ